mgnify:CR=1 FL=1
MRCPSCGFENPEGMKFCGQCASPLGRRCPQCGFDNPSGFAFCGQCATPLTEPPPAPQPQAPLRYTPSHLAEKILTSRAALEGERKQVTVLFADLKGSMELLADRDPEEARQLLDRFLHHAEVITITGKSYRLKNRAKGKNEDSADDDTCQAVSV